MFDTLKTEADSCLIDNHWWHSAVLVFSKTVLNTLGLTRIRRENPSNYLLGICGYKSLIDMLEPAGSAHVGHAYIHILHQLDCTTIQNFANNYAN